MTTTYACLKQNVLVQAEYQLVPLRREDIFLIKDWRNRQMDILRQKAILTDEDQVRYYEDVIQPSFSHPTPDQVLFSFLQRQELIGYGGLVHIHWHDRRAEVSYLVDPDRVADRGRYGADFNVFLFLLKKVAFEFLGFHRLTTECYDLRPFHVAILEKNGFRPEGRLRNHVSVSGRFVDSLVHGLLAEDPDREDRLEPGTRKTGNCLITSISRKVPLIQAVRNASKRVASDFRIHGNDMDETCVGRYFVDEFWHSGSLADLSPEDLVNELGKREIRYIIPTRDGELGFWAGIRSKLEKHGISVMVSPPETIQACLDKLEFCGFCRDRGIPSIPTSPDVSEIQADCLVVKERYGAGSRHAGLKLSRIEAEERSKNLAHPIYQPYVEGNEYSFDAYMDREGRVKGVVVRRRDRVVDGESVISTTILDAELMNEIRGYVEQFRFYGHVVGQFIRDIRGNINVIEINPRFGGASTLSIQAGLDSFRWFLLESMGFDLARVPFVPAKGALRQVRYPTDLVIPG